MSFAQLTPRPLTSAAIRMYSPLAPGVYGISNAREWIYIGETDNIRDALIRHLSELDPSLTAGPPAGFVFEICDGPLRASRQDQLIHEYKPMRQQQVRKGNQ